MSTIGRRLAVLATLVALMAAPIVTAAAAPAAADQFASIAISTSPSGDVPVGQAMTVTVDWGVDFPPPTSRCPSSSVSRFRRASASTAASRAPAS